MKRAFELSGHDTATGKQIDAPDKKVMGDDLESLRTFCKDCKKGRPRSVSEGERN